MGDESLSICTSEAARFGTVKSYSFRRKNTNDLCNFPVRFYKDDEWAVEVACALRLNPLIPKYE